MAHTYTTRTHIVSDNGDNETLDTQNGNILCVCVFAEIVTIRIYTHNLRSAGSRRRRTICQGMHRAALTFLFKQKPKVSYHLPANVEYQRISPSAFQFPRGNYSFSLIEISHSHSACKLERCKTAGPL